MHLLTSLMRSEFFKILDLELSFPSNGGDVARSNGTLQAVVIVEIFLVYYRREYNSLVSPVSHRGLTPLFWHVLCVCVCGHSPSAIAGIRDQVST